MNCKRLLTALERCIRCLEQEQNQLDEKEKRQPVFAAHGKAIKQARAAIAHYKKEEL
jgi:hypothetical protein